MSEGSWDPAKEAWLENRKGYCDQMQWLQGKSIPEARHALAERASLERNEYNGGGNAATCDYIERLKLAGSR